MAKAMKAMPATLGEAIADGIQDRGWSIAKLARELDTDRTLVSGWIRGIGSPSHRHFETMAGLFGWPLPYDSGGSTTPE